MTNFYQQVNNACFEGRHHTLYVTSFYRVFIQMTPLQIIVTVLIDLVWNLNYLKTQTFQDEYFKKLNLSEWIIAF